jgi:hypothetical protein
LSSTLRRLLESRSQAPSSADFKTLLIDASVVNVIGVGSQFAMRDATPVVMYRTEKETEIERDFGKVR